MPTLAELHTELTAVNAAYMAALNGQEYEIRSADSSRRLKRQSLSDLLKRKTQLEQAVERAGGSGGIRYGVPCP